MTSRAIRDIGAVTPAEYLGLAVELAQPSGAAARRSAIDRAYYAAFLAARDEMSNKGYISVVRGAQVHTQVAEALNRINEEAGRRLRDLRRTRNRLTYHTDKATLPYRLSLDTLLDSARSVIEAARALPQSPV